MTNAQFYKDYVKEYMIKGDNPGNRQVYYQAKDMLHRDGLITDKQVQNWVYPKLRYFE